jgi:hypothetical protein
MPMLPTKVRPNIDDAGVVTASRKDTLLPASCLSNHRILERNRIAIGVR